MIAAAPIGLTWLHWAAGERACDDVDAVSAGVRAVRAPAHRPVHVDAVDLHNAS